MQIQRCCQRSALMPSLIVLATSPGPSHILFQILVSQLCLLHHDLLIGSKEAVTLLLIQQQSSYQILCYLLFSIRVIFHLVYLLFVWKMPTIVLPRFDFMHGRLKKKKNQRVLAAVVFRVFWVNIAKFEVNLRYRNCSNLFEILRREIEFRYYRCRNSNKSMREKKKKGERENVEFRQWRCQIFCVQFCGPGVRGVPKVKRKKKFDKLIVAMPLPKQGKKKKRVVLKSM